MEDGRLPADARFVDGGAGIDVGPAVEEQCGSSGMTVFRGHVQKRPSLNREAASTSHAAIEFRETPGDECGISVNLLGQSVEPAAQQLQHPWNVEPGHATGLEKDVDAGAQALGVTRVRRDDVVESRAWIRMAADLVPMFATVRIGAVIEEPFERSGLQG